MRSIVLPAVLLAGVFAVAPVTARAQAPATASAPATDLRGQVFAAETRLPVVGAAVLVEELNASTYADSDGAFVLTVPATGVLHVRVTADGYLPLRLEVPATGRAPLEITLQEDLHYAEAVTVGPAPRDPFESYQATSVLAGQELLLKTEGSLGGLLRSEPGVSERSMGPGPSRPVIRGQDGDRVLVLQNSQRTGDLSSQSGDHGVPVNPAAATQVEVVRGPATLLYGPNAIGGLVNVISNQIPMKPVTGITGQAIVDLATNGGQAGVAGDLSFGSANWVLNVGGSGRRAGDYRTPDGRIDNSQSRGGFGSVGVSRTSALGYFGAGVQMDDTRYGVPVVEDGEIELTPRRQVYMLRGERRELPGLFTSVRGAVSFHRYRHEEFHGDEIGTRFRNDMLDVDVRATHRAVGKLTGTVGVSGYDRRFEAVGEEALSPRVDQRVVSAFSYEEITWPHLTLQFGGRFDHARYSPAGGLRPRDFNNVSLSLGTLFRPTHASTLAVSLARAARNPALEELYFFGTHMGNLAFEIGNDDLKSEVAYGVDVSWRTRLPRLSTEITYFNNTVRDYIFRQEIAEDEFEARFGHLDHGHDHGHEGHDHDHDHGEELPYVEFVGRDARLQGIEAHVDGDLGRGFHAEVGVDTVRGTQLDGRGALPRIPPARVRAGISYHRNALQLGAHVLKAFDQRRVYGVETPTDGYTTLQLSGAWSVQAGRLLHTVSVRVDNVTDTLYRNHLNLIKNLVPEMGRSARVAWNVRF